MGSNVGSHEYKGRARFTQRTQVNATYLLFMPLIKILTSLFDLYTDGTGLLDIYTDKQ